MMNVKAPVEIYRACPLLALALAIGCWTPAYAQGDKSSPGTSEVVVVTAADATLLAQEALAEAPFNFAVRLEGVEVIAPRVRVRASVPWTCDITLEGTPLLQSGRIAVSGVVERRTGLGCAAIPALNPKPWDLAGRLEHASCDRTLPGPRLAGVPCLPAGSLRLESMSVLADGMHVRVLLPQP